MAYEKLGLADGQVLKAEHLEHIENGIAENAKALASKIGQEEVDTAVESALETAKESGQFDGATPVIETSKIDGVTTITITIGEEVHTITINDGTATDEQVEAFVQEWFDEHPEATATVEDGSITYDKLAEDVKNELAPLQSMNGCIVCNGEEITLVVGEDVEDGQVINFKYKLSDGYSVGWTAPNSIGIPSMIPPVMNAGYGEASETIDGTKTSYTFTGCYFVAIRPCSGSGEGVTGGSTARIGEVILLADNWTGENNLYSQVVNIDGATENTQVDLTPSVEQLAIFYEKDLAFVTENENGVVTVYAIGQKPTNDYTIQVTMTEVAYE